MTLGMVVVIVAYAAFIQWVWGWGTIMGLWSHAGWGTIALALLLLVATYLLRTWRIYDYFPRETKSRFATLFRVVQLHNILNIMLPFRSGETSFPLLMRREFGVNLLRGTLPFWSCGSSICTHFWLQPEWGGRWKKEACGYGPVGWHFCFYPRWDLSRVTSLSVSSVEDRRPSLPRSLQS